MNKQELGPIARAAAKPGLREAYEAERVRREYEESPEYRIGCELLDGLTQELGISAEQAAALLSGSTRPEIASTYPIMATASSKLPAMPLSAASSKLPNDCPLSCPSGKR